MNPLSEKMFNKFDCVSISETFVGDHQIVSQVRDQGEIPKEGNMKSPLFVLVIIILGSLSFPMEQSNVESWEYRVQSDLESERAFNRLYPWVEDQYNYSHRQYHWEGEDRIISVRRGISAYEDSRGRRIRYGYTMDIRIQHGELQLSFSDVEPIESSLLGSRRRGELQQEALRQDLMRISQGVESLFL